MKRPTLTTVARIARCAWPLAVVLVAALLILALWPKQARPAAAE